MIILHKSLSLFSSSIIALILLVSCNDRKESAAMSENKASIPVIDSVKQDTAIIAAPLRESITFILGEDKDAGNPYYSEASKYYSNNPVGKTTYMVTSCRSLIEVRNHLVKHVSPDSPWGRINLVSHGDQWLGLSVKVTPESRRSTPERLQEFLQTGTFNPMPDSVIDQQSEVVIHACGIGNNIDFVETLALVFKATSTTPQVIAPRLFEFYSSGTDQSGNLQSLNYMTKAWMVSYKKGDKPGNLILCNLLQEKYPEAHISWQDALSREHPRFGGDSYHYTFDIPVNMVVNIPLHDSLPNFSTIENKLMWINQQSDIKHILSKIQIPAEKFSWNLKSGYARNKAGKRTRAISVKGFCTILCILKPLTDEKLSSAGSIRPLVPAITDTTFYYQAQGKPCNIKL